MSHLHRFVVPEIARPDGDVPRTIARSSGRGRSAEGADSSVGHSEESPGAGNAFKFVFATVDEVDSGADDERWNGPGDEYLACVRVSQNSGTNVHADARDIAATPSASRAGHSALRAWS